MNLNVSKVRYLIVIQLSIMFSNSRLYSKWMLIGKSLSCLHCEVRIEFSWLRMDLSHAAESIEVRKQYIYICIDFFNKVTRVRDCVLLFNVIAPFMKIIFSWNSSKKSRCVGYRVNCHIFCRILNYDLFDNQWASHINVNKRAKCSI